MVNNRILHVSPEFLKKMKQLQGKIKAKDGEDTNLPDVTDKILATTAFIEVEKQILEQDKRILRKGLKFDEKL